MNLHGWLSVVILTGCSISCIGCVELMVAIKQFLFRHLCSCSLNFHFYVTMSYFSISFHSCHSDHFSVLLNCHLFLSLKFLNLLLVSVNNNTTLNFSYYQPEQKPSYYPQLVFVFLEFWVQQENSQHPNCFDNMCNSLRFQEFPIIERYYYLHLVSIVNQKLKLFRGFTFNFENSTCFFIYHLRLSSCCPIVEQYHHTELGRERCFRTLFVHHFVSSCFSLLSNFLQLK